MAISTVQDKREMTGSTLLYIWRGDGHEHEIEMVELIGGNNMINFSPVFKDGVDISLLADQFHQHTADNYTGCGKKPYVHFMVSLAPGEYLDNKEWQDFLQNDLMPTMGFCDSAPWHAAKHSDKSHEHAHIVASLVSKDGRLIDTNEMAIKSFEAMRRLEIKHNLQILESPGECFGNNFSAKEIMIAKKHVDVESGKVTVNEQCVKNNKAAVIRARFKAIRSQYNGKMPTTFSALVIELQKKGVEVKASENKNGGLNLVYRDSLDKENEIWISSSKVGSNSYTFKGLTERFNVSYKPSRDNKMLGIGNNEISLSFDVSFEISRAQYKRVKRYKALCNAAIRSKNQRYWVEFKVGMTKKEREMLKTIQFLLVIIDLLFGRETSEEVEFKEFLYLEHLRELEQQVKELSTLESSYLDQLQIMRSEREGAEEYINAEEIDLSNRSFEEITELIDKATIWRHETSEIEVSDVVDVVNVEADSEIKVSDAVNVVADVQLTKTKHDSKVADFFKKEFEKMKSEKVKERDTENDFDIRDRVAFNPELKPKSW